MELSELNNEDVKDLLLEDYRYHGESLRKNEESGETRVNFYITILAALPVAVVALSEKREGSILENPDIHDMLLITLTSFFIFGVFIFLRLLKRNKITDELKFALDNIRQQYKDIYDRASLMISVLPQKGNPMVSLKENNGKHDKIENRSWGSLAHLVALLNAMVIGAISFILSHTNANQAFAIASSVFVISLLVQKYVIILKEKKVRAKIKSNLYTHAGGIVFRQVPEVDEINPVGIEYLVLTNKSENQKTTGKKYIFPRGHIEEDEEVSQCALREVYEEAGVVAQLLKPVGFYNDANSINKVRLYLMELLYVGKSIEDRDRLWLPFEKAYKQLTFTASKSMILQVHSFLLSRNAKLSFQPGVK